jgi:Kef-type K+ transport system membrane component KefB
MPTASVETITGRLGVGSICFLAFFFVIDGMQIGVFHLVETYGDSVTFGIVAALSTAVVAYIFGVFCVGTADLVLSRFAAFKEPDPEKLYALSISGGDLLKQSYSEIIRILELLKGLFIAFLLLALGTVLDASNMLGYKNIVILAFIIAIALSVLSLLFARRSVIKAKRILELNFGE